MYKKLKASEEKPKRERASVSLFELTEEWRLMKADLDKGLKPSEALQVVWTEKEKEKYGITFRRTIQRFISDYLAERKLPYAVNSFERKETGDFVILVKYPPAIRKRA